MKPQEHTLLTKKDQNILADWRASEELLDNHKTGKHPRIANELMRLQNRVDQLETELEEAISKSYKRDITLLH
jgi:hypothetical protein